MYGVRSTYLSISDLPTGGLLRRRKGGGRGAAGLPEGPLLWGDGPLCGSYLKIRAESRLEEMYVCTP